LITAPKIKVVIVGSGNLAWHLVKLFSEKKIKPVVYNHRPSAGLKEIKKQFKCEIFSNLNNINTEADYYFICVNDQHITKVSKYITPARPEAFVLHFSGSAPISSIKTKHQNKAVLYPLQSFSKNLPVNWKEIPIFIQTHNEAKLENIDKLLKFFTGKKVICDDESRLHIHLSAVLVNNFTNALYSQAFLLLKKEGNEQMFSWFLPLIKTGVNKLNSMQPIEAQTGPAKRGDKGAMKRHLKLIKSNKKLSKIYSSISELIVEQQKSNYV